MIENVNKVNKIFGVVKTFERMAEMISCLLTGTVGYADTVTLRVAMFREHENTCKCGFSGRQA